ncbi:DUF2125 domain-containing protein [Paracoccus denitrificans]|uniref:DUF2125 domain-containing protein n=1 Tax=Paracoccus denitrificans TaxID=266 RepID=UPI001E630A81|nr:DUF2125 domain-containing protein [Paracoccus denitrificans]UFS64825.1 DUF2125 domain-containing protein [Paracoccus denitrificans]
MRRLLAPLIVLALILGGLWLGGESLLAQQLRRIAAQEPMAALGAVQELRDPRRIGVRVSALELQTGAGRIELPQAELWLTPLRPTTLRLALPPRAVLDPGSGPLELGLADATARLRVQPLNGLGMASAGISAGVLTIEGTELAKGLQADAELAALDANAPPDAAAAYDLDLTLDDLEPGLFATLPLPGRLSMNATGRVWLDALPRPSTLTPDLAPLPVGLQLDDAELRLGAVQARILGRVEADAQGRAQGRVVLYTRDAKPLLQAAATAGLIPPKVVTLAGTMLKNISDLPLPENAGFSFPPPAEGELRLPLSFADGKTSLGPVVLGPAPAFPRR